VEKGVSTILVHNSQEIAFANRKILLNINAMLVQVLHMAIHATTLVPVIVAPVYPNQNAQFVITIFIMDHIASTDVLMVAIEEHVTKLLGTVLKDATPIFAGINVIYVHTDYTVNFVI
jgi:hypothetical protein